MGYYNSHMYVMRRWADKTGGANCSSMANQVLKEIKKDPFQEFSEKKDIFLQIMKREGGLSPSVKRAVFIAVAMKGKEITKETMKETFRVMDSVFDRERDLEKRLRDHAIELLLEAWNRANELKI